MFSFYLFIGDEPRAHKNGVYSISIRAMIRKSLVKRCISSQYLVFGESYQNTDQ